MKCTQHERKLYMALMYMYVCVHTCIKEYPGVCIHIYIYIYIYTCLYAHKYIHITAYMVTYSLCVYTN